MNTESVALEVFILDQCKHSSHIALMVFWLFQAHFSDTIKNPQGVSFKTCQRMFNKIQHIIFDEKELSDLNDFKVRKNTFPSILLSSVIIGSVSVPLLSKVVGPIAIAQSRPYRPQLKETDKQIFQHTLFSDCFSASEKKTFENMSNCISTLQLDQKSSDDKLNLCEFSQISSRSSQETLFLPLCSEQRSSRDAMDYHSIDLHSNFDTYLTEDLYSKKSLLSDFYTENYAFIKYESIVLNLTYVKVYGDIHSEEYRSAQDCFMRSLAAYSLICYLFQLKDRHNGNILLDTEGHLIHIDFGFMLTNTPGNVGFENAPFKLTMDYVNILGDRFNEWKDLMKQAFKALRKKAEDLILLVRVMQNESKLPCFSSGALTSVQFQQRFQLQLSEMEVDEFMEMLITKAYSSVWTRLYDHYQQLSQGIY
ncbi:hypothetical protein PCK2_000682 [Pneumocystis canis]|nr:hypothetical protein PCK2_000682 [Pneumocystis canis]